MARTLCQAVLVPHWWNPTTLRDFVKSAFRESLCQGLAVVSDFVQWWSLKFPPSEIWQQILTWGTGASGNALPRRQLPQAAAAAHCSRMGILVLTHLVLGQGEDQWDRQCQFSSALSKEAATCSKPCHRAWQSEEDIKCVDFPSFGRTIVKCRKLKGDKKSLSFSLQDLQGFKKIRTRWS